MLHISILEESITVNRGLSRADKDILAARCASARIVNSSQISLDVFTSLIQRGKCFYYAVLKDHVAQKTRANFLYSNAVILDIDNKRTDVPTLSWSDALQHPYVQEHACMLFESPNTTKEQNRYRIAFSLPFVVEDADAYDAIAKEIAKEFPPQLDILTRPSWGYSGCRTRIVGRGSFVQRTEAARLWDAAKHIAAEVSRRRTEAVERAAQMEREHGAFPVAEAVRLVGCFTRFMPYYERTQVIISLVNEFGGEVARYIVEQSEVLQGKNKEYLRTIASADATRQHGGRGYSIGTAIWIARAYGYEPIRKERKPKWSKPKKQFDHTRNNRCNCDTVAPTHTNGGR